jgi:pimeloyl-ACP methyl ester carboxylesterase
VSKISARGASFLAEGTRFNLEVDGRAVTGWSWGQGAATFVVHGWGGSSGRLYTLGEALLQRGGKLVMFDAPGHGASGRGLSSMPEFARSIRAVAELQGSPEVIVAHSLGAAATALAASWGLRAGRYVFLAPAANPAEWATAFSATLRLSPEVMTRLRRRSEARLRFSWNDLDARQHARKMTAPLLVIHDRTDRVVPFANGSDIAASWPGARLIETSGLGHTDLMRDPGVISHVLSFLASQ